MGDQYTEQLSLFRAVTGNEDDTVAVSLLSKYGWDVQAAVEDYLATGGIRGEAEAEAEASLTDAAEGAHDRSPLLGNRDGDGGGGANRQPMEGRPREAGNARRGYDVTGRSEAFYSATSILAVPLKAVALVLRALLYPVRLLTTSRGTATQLQQPSVAARYFVQEFEREYGRCRPNFLQESFQEATRRSQRQNQLLLIYLHSPLHEDTPTFCRQTLTTTTFVSFLQDNLLVWGGNIQHPDAFLASQLLDAAAFPFVALLSISGRPAPLIRVLDHSEGMVGVEALLQRLTFAMQRHQEYVDRQAGEERERHARTQLQEEQRREYQEALAADRRRDSQRAAEEHAAALAAHEAKKREEDQILEQERQKAERRQSIEMKRARIPQEPMAGDRSALRLRLQFPHGRKWDRRFLQEDTIQALRDCIDIYVTEHEISLVNYSLSTSFPRRVFDDPTATLGQLGLHSADTIYITDLEA